jgi:prepilin-type N-terminal cleavage/methylation domain-containing protein
VSANTEITVMDKPDRLSSGFTIPELLISISLIGIISVSLVAVILNYFVIITRNNISTDMTVDSQNLLRATVEELRYGAGVRQTNTLTDLNGPAGGWNTSNASFVIIIAVPAKDTGDNYIIDFSTGAPYNNELVYFKQGKNLYKRILAHPSAAGNTQKTSCPAAVANASCPEDRKLNDATKDMVFTLYDQDDVVTTNPLLARSIKINLQLERDTFGQPLVLNNSIRTTLRNRFE